MESLIGIVWSDILLKKRKEKTKGKKEKKVSNSFLI